MEAIRIISRQIRSSSCSSTCEDVMKSVRGDEDVNGCALRSKSTRNERGQGDFQTA